MKKTNLETLKKDFDRVCLKHICPTPQTGTTIAILVKGKTAYVGVSRCREGDQFSKEIGRNISLGRALAVIEDSKITETRFSVPVLEGTENLMDTIEAQVTSVIAARAAEDNS